MATTAVATTRENPLKTLSDLLENKSRAIAEALPQIGGRGGEANARRLIKIALQACSRNPRLMESTRESIYGALLQCAELGLEPGPLGEAYLVPFKNNKTGKMEAQFQAGFRGLIKLARRSSEIASITANVVHQADRFEYRVTEKGPHLLHEPALVDDPGPMTHAYMVAVLRDGTPQIEVMTRAQIEKTRKVSRAKDDGPWVDWYDEMARKTVVKRGCKYLPLSSDLQRALEADTEPEVEEPIRWTPPPDVARSAELAAQGAIPVGAGPEPTDEELAAKLEAKRSEPPPADEEAAMAAAVVYEGMTEEEQINHWLGLIAGTSTVAELGKVRDEVLAAEPHAASPVRKATEKAYQARVDALRRKEGR